jgi:hypothetical protein
MGGSVFHWLIMLALVGLVVVVPVALLLIVVLSRRPGGSPSLYPCPDCRRLVSVHATVCPGCGRPLTPGAG